MDKIDKWLMERRGCFSASENHRLLTPPKGNELFSSGAVTYIKQKAIEAITDIWERPDIDETDSILHGKAHEYPAYEEFVRVTRNFDVKYLGEEHPIFLPYPSLETEAGGTPDSAAMSGDIVTRGAEFKCPKNPAVHFERLKWKNQFDIFENYRLVYTQIQNLMMCTGATEWYFVSYDARYKIKSKRAVIIPVYPDKKFNDNFEARLRQAIKEKYRILSDYLGDSIANHDELRRFLR